MGSRSAGARDNRRVARGPFRDRLFLRSAEPLTLDAIDVLDAQGNANPTVVAADFAVVCELTDIAASVCTLTPNVFGSLSLLS